MFNKSKQKLIKKINWEDVLQMSKRKTKKMIAMLLALTITGTNFMQLTANAQSTDSNAVSENNNEESLLVTLFPDDAELVAEISKEIDISEYEEDFMSKVEIEINAEISAEISGFDKDVINNAVSATIRECLAEYVENDNMIRMIRNTAIAHKDELSEYMDLAVYEIDLIFNRFLSKYRQKIIDGILDRLTIECSTSQNDNDSLIIEVIAPDTEAPVTEAPVTEATVTEITVTEATQTEVVTTITEITTTEATTTEATTTEATTTEATTTEATTTEATTTEATTTEATTTEATTEVIVTEPTTEATTTETTQTEVVTTVTEDQKPEDHKHGDQKPEDHKPGDHKPGDQKPEDHKPGDQKPEDQKPEDQKPEDQKPEDQKPEDQEPEDQKPEDQEPEDQEPEDQKPEDQEPEDTGSETTSTDTEVITKVVYGDLNGDGKVDLTDITTMSLALMYKDLPEELFVLADVDANGEFDIADLSTIKQFICKDPAVTVLGPELKALRES